MNGSNAKRRGFALLAAASLAFGTGLACAATVDSSVVLPGRQVFPESVASTADGTLYVGSIGSGGVFRVSPGATAAVRWIEPGASGSHSTFGVLADGRSGTLWVCSNNLSAQGVGASIPDQTKGSWLEGFNLKTGAGKLRVKLPGKQAFCNDIAVAPDGSVYVTNSAAPQIFKLSPDREHLRIWATDPRFKPEGGTGLDGLAFGADGNLYVDTYVSARFFRVAVNGGKAGAITELEPSRKLVLADALRPLGGDTFLLVEGAGRLDRAVVHGDAVSIETLRSGFATPTGVTVTRGRAWVAEGQLAYVFDPARRGQTPRLPFRLYAVQLPTRLGHTARN